MKRARRRQPSAARPRTLVRRRSAPLETSLIAVVGLAIVLVASAAAARGPARPEGERYLLPEPPRRIPELAVGALGGFVVGGAPAVVAAAGQLDFSVRWLPLLVRIAALIESPTVQHRQDRPSLHRWESRFRLEVGADLVLDVWRLTPSFGAGVALSRAWAPDPDNEPSVTRVLPVLSLALDVSRAIGRWRVRSQLCINAYPSHDQYLLENVGELGRSPQASLLLVVGIERVLLAP